MKTYWKLMKTYVTHNKDRTSLHNGSHTTTEASFDAWLYVNLKLMETYWKLMKTSQKLMKTY